MGDEVFDSGHAAFDFIDEIEGMTDQPAVIARMGREFAKFGFTARRRTDYVVTSEFPRIVESTLAAGISEVSYVLHLSAGKSFALEPTALMEAIRAAHELS